MTDQPPVRSRSTTFAKVVACFVLMIEAIALGVASAAYLVTATVADAEMRTRIAGIGVLALVATVALAAACVGVWRGRRWAVSLAVTWQVLQVAVGAYALTIAPEAGVIAIVFALVGGAAALRSSSPPST